MGRTHKPWKEVGSVFECEHCGCEIDSRDCFVVDLHHRKHDLRSAFPTTTQAASMYLCHKCGLEFREFIYAMKGEVKRRGKAENQRGA